MPLNEEEEKNVKDYNQNSPCDKIMSENSLNESGDDYEAYDWEIADEHVKIKLSKSPSIGQIKPKAHWRA